MKLKETLNLGKTEFPMRAGLPQQKNQYGKKNGMRQSFINAVKN